MKTISSPQGSARMLVALVSGSLGLAFAGCEHTSKNADYPDHPNDNPAITAAPTTEESHAFTGTAGDRIGDDYIYYPGYEVYYSPAHKEYVYYDGKVWVRSTQANQMWANHLESASSVPMTFHDDPEHHHTEVVRQYPRTWQPTATGQPAPTTNDAVVKGSTN